MEGKTGRDAPAYARERELAAAVVRDVCPSHARRCWKIYRRRSLVLWLVQQRYFREVRSALEENGLPPVRDPKALVDDFWTTFREIVDRAAADAMAERILKISEESLKNPK